MSKEKLTETLKKQHYGLVGNHSGVQICRWTKKSLVDEGVCYKEQFYGIKSHLCCQMSPAVGYCQNRCLHCWRAIELTLDNKMKKENIDSPKQIIKDCIEQQRILINGFKGNSKINLEKFKQAQEPMQFAISLVGEPTLYPKLGGLIFELKKQGKTCFLVTNGLCPEVLKKLADERNLPTQLYVSMNSPNEKLYNKWHKSSEKNAWKKFNQSLEIMKDLKTRTVIRMTLVKGPYNNMKNEYIEDYIRLIKKSECDFIEIKGYKAVGFARNRKDMGYNSMPTHDEVKEFAKKIVKTTGYQIEDDFEPSCVVLLKRDDFVKRFIS